MVKGVTANNVTNTPGAIGRSVPAQPRWPADHPASGRLGVRPAQGQPRGDRRVPDRDQHVRHHAGPLDRDAGAGDLPLGHQRPARLDLWVLPQRQASTRADPVTGKVLPFENQQAGVTLGGPIIQNKMHFFGSYEYERQPATAFLAPTRLPAPDLRSSRRSRSTRTIWAGSTIRLSSTNTFTVRGQRWAFDNPFVISSGTAHPSTAEQLSSRIRPTSSAPGRMSSSSNLMMQLHGGLQRLLLVQRCDPVE